MLYLDDRQIEEVAPEMTVKEIREIKNPEKVLIKPNTEDRKRLDAFAEKLIRIDKYHEWMLEDFTRRVLDTASSPGELKSFLGYNSRSWYFKFKDNVIAINLFDEYVQVNDENGDSKDFEWFYLAAAIQSMWNVVAMKHCRKESADEHEVSGQECTEHGFTSIDKLDLSVSTFNALYRAGIDTVEQLQEMTDEDLSRIRNLGKRCLDEIHSKLEKVIPEEVCATSHIEESVDSIEQCEREHLCNYDEGEDIIDVPAEEFEEAPEEISEEKYEEASGLTDLELAMEQLNKANSLLKDLIEYYSENDVRVRRQKNLVAALASYVCNLDDIINPPQKHVETEIPMLRNMEERERFILNFKEWPIWCRNTETEETFYRCNLPDGSAIVVRSFPMRLEWNDVDTGGKELYLITENTKHFKDGETNMTSLKEHIKIVQKGMRNDENNI